MSVPAEVVLTVSTPILYVGSMGSNPNSVPALVAQDRAPVDASFGRSVGESPTLWVPSHNSSLVERSVEARRAASSILAYGTSESSVAVNASACQVEDRGFESLLSLQPL